MYVGISGSAREFCVHVNTSSVAVNLQANGTVFINYAHESGLENFVVALSEGCFEVLGAVVFLAIRDHPRHILREIFSRHIIFQSLLELGFVLEAATFDHIVFRMFEASRGVIIVSVNVD